MSLLITLVLLFINCIGQNTFSNRYAYGHSAIFKMVMKTDYGYLIIGEGRDNIGEYLAPLLAISYDEQGEVISTKTYGSADLEFVYDTVADAEVMLNDSTFVFLSQYFQEGVDTNYVAVIWMDEYGDTLQTRKYTSPYYIEGELYTDSNSPAALTISDDGEFLYYAAQIFHSSSQNNFLIKKLTAQGDEVWTYVNPLNMWYGSSNVIQYYQGQVWFVAQASGEQNHYNKLKSLNDTTGVVEYDVEHDGSEFILGGASDAIIDSEGYCVTAVGGSVNNLIPYTFKVDLEGDYLWYTAPNGENAPQQMSDHLVKSPDGGYVSCSVKYDEQINPEDPNDPSSNNTSEKIWLWKVDSEGVFQWQRFYEYIGFDSGYFYLNNTAKDMKATPDGGYIMAGEATASCLQWPECDDFTQQGWLLKVDGCGCLVPGCDEGCIVGIEELANNEARREWFLVGPNPARDMLNVYFGPSPTLPKGKGVVLVVHNLVGKLVGSFDLKHDDTTYMIDTTSLASGEYVVSLVSEGVVLQSEKIVVAR